MPNPTVSFTDERLPNGLRLVIAEDHLAPVVAVNIWYNVGSKHEVEGKTGFAHLFEHVMFQGSRNVAKASIALIQAAGGTMNGTTWLDRTNYFETVPSHQLELALWLEADRMGTLLDALSQDNLDNQREVVKNEKRWSYDNRPYGSWNEKIQAHLFPRAPLPSYDDRLDGGSRRRVGRGRQRVLSNVLRAEQRGPDGRRRCRSGGRPEVGRALLRASRPTRRSRRSPIMSLRLRSARRSARPCTTRSRCRASTSPSSAPVFGDPRWTRSTSRRRCWPAARQPAPSASRPRGADRPGRRAVHARVRRRRRSRPAGRRSPASRCPRSRRPPRGAGADRAGAGLAGRAGACESADRERGAGRPQQGRGAGRPPLDVRDAVRRPGPRQPDARPVPRRHCRRHPVDRGGGVPPDNRVV